MMVSLNEGHGPKAVIFVFKDVNAGLVFPL
jgi:hypothetical protein